MKHSGPYRSRTPAGPAASEAGPAVSIRERNRAKLLAAAEWVFAETGFQGATTAAIAARAGLPKANLHYYFGTKEALYRAVLDAILTLWLDALDSLRAERSPAEALAEYVAAKIRLSATRPNASKVFANEILHGAPQIRGYLGRELRHRVEEKSAVIRQWIAAGRMDAVDPAHLIFMLWAATQHYADFEVQVREVLGRTALGTEDFARAAETITAIVLKGCGLEATPAGVRQRATRR